MHATTEDWRGVIIELDHTETAQFTNFLSGSGITNASLVGALTVLGVTAAAAPIVAGVILLHIAWEVPAIKAMDKGQGVILTMPWLAPGVLIPATRHAASVDQNWVSQRVGTFISAGGDALDYRVDHGVGNPNEILFRLVDNCAWDKSFTLRGAAGTVWDAKATRAAAVEKTLSAQQPQNGQLLTFSKPGFLGIWHEVFTVGGVSAMTGGDRATFTWQRD